MATGSQNGSPLFLGGIFHKTGTGKWPPYGGSSLYDEVFRPLECISRFLMHSNGLFNFACRGFRLTAISTAWIILVKRGTTVVVSVQCNRASPIPLT